MSHSTEKMLRDFRNACESGDLDRVNELLLQGVDPSKKPIGVGYSYPIVTSSMYGHLNIVKKLL